LEKPIDYPKAYAEHELGSKRGYEPIVIDTLQGGNGRHSLDEEGSKGDISQNIKRCPNGVGCSSNIQ